MTQPISNRPPAWHRSSKLPSNSKTHHVRKVENAERRTPHDLTQFSGPKTPLKQRDASTHEVEKGWLHKRGSDSGIDTGSDLSDDETGLSGKSATVEQERLDKKIKKKRGHITKQIETLACQQENSPDITRELQTGIVDYFNTLQESKARKELCHEALALRKEIKDKLPSVTDVHQGWLSQSPNNNRKALVEQASYLAREACLWLPGAVYEHAPVTMLESEGEQAVTGYIILSSLVSADMFSSEKDFIAFKMMCRDQIEQELATTADPMVLFLSVNENLGKLQPKESLPSLLRLKKFMKPEMFPAEDEYWQCFQAVEKQIVAKLGSPFPGTKNVSVTDKERRDADSPARRAFEKFYSEQEACNNRPGNITLIGQCLVDMDRQGLQLKRNGRAVYKHDSFRPGASKKTQTREQLLDQATKALAEYTKSMDTKQVRQMLSMLNQTVFNSMASVLDMSVRREMPYLGPLSMANSPHLIEVDIDADGTVIMDFILETRNPKSALSAVPGTLMEYGGDSKVTLKRQIRLAKGKSMKMSYPSISIRLENGRPM